MVAYVECILAPGIAAGERSGECDDFRMWAPDLKNPYLQQQSIVGLNYSRCAQLSGHPEGDLQSLYDMVAVYLRPGTSDAAAFKQVCFTGAADTRTLRCKKKADRTSRQTQAGIMYFVCSPPAPPGQMRASFFCSLSDPITSRSALITRGCSSKPQRGEPDDFLPGQEEIVQLDACLHVMPEE